MVSPIRALKISALLMGALMAMSLMAIAGLTSEEKHEISRTSSAYAKQPTTFTQEETISLEEILRTAMANNAAVREAFFEWKIAASSIAEARSLEDPVVGYEAQWMQQDDGWGVDRQGILVEQMFPFPGKKLLAGQMATEVSRRKAAIYQKAWLTVAFEVKGYFLDYWYLNKAILVKQENQELLAHLEEVAQSKFRSGMASNEDLLNAQIELAILANDILSLNAYRKPLIAELNRLMNRQTDLELGNPQEVTPALAALDPQDLLQRLLENNPDLIAAERRIDEAYQRIRLSQISFLPDAGVEAKYLAARGEPMIGSSGGRDEWMLGVRMNVPFWIGKQNSVLEQARAEHEVSSAAQQKTKQMLSSALTMIIFRAGEAERKILLYRDALVPKAEQLLRATEASYKSGTADFQSLMASERSLLNFQLAYYEAVRDYEKSLAEIEMMIAEPLREENHERK